MTGDKRDPAMFPFIWSTLLKHFGKKL